MALTLSKHLLLGLLALLIGAHTFDAFADPFSKYEAERSDVEAEEAAYDKLVERVRVGSLSCVFCTTGK